MFTAQWKTVGFLNIISFLNLFSPLPHWQNPSMPGTWVAQGNISLHWDKSYDFLLKPQYVPLMPKPKPFNQCFPVFYSFLSQYSTGRSIRKSSVHKSPRSLLGERNLTAGYFNILSKAPNPEQRCWTSLWLCQTTGQWIQCATSSSFNIPSIS